MTILTGDCIEVMAGMEPASVDAIVTDPPYGLEFMGKEWDRLDLWNDSGGNQKAEGYVGADGAFRRKTQPISANMQAPRFTAGASAQAFHAAWATAALRVAKPGAYLLAFGGTRTVHRMTCALEDAGWIIRDMLVWGYASGFPKSRSLLKPAWEPIVMARKPGPLLPLAIDDCRIAAPDNEGVVWTRGGNQQGASLTTNTSGVHQVVEPDPSGRWPANIILTDPVLGDEFSRFFLVPKASRSDREPLEPGGLEQQGDRGYGQGKGVKTRECRQCGDRTQASEKPYEPACRHGDWEWVDALPLARRNVHPTVKPTELMRHLVRLVTPAGGLVLDPFLGSGTTGVACEMEGFAWLGIEREPEYVAIAEQRLIGIDRGLGLIA